METPRYTPEQALDLLRTMFAEMWDGACDFLEAINEILGATTGLNTYEHTGDGDEITWREAGEAWERAFTAIGRQGIPPRTDVVKLLEGIDDEVAAGAFLTELHKRIGAGQFGEFAKSENVDGDTIRVITINGNVFLVSAKGEEEGS